MKTSKLIDWAIIAFCLIAACGFMRAEEPKQTICGANIKGPNVISRHTELIQVSCPIWASIAAIGALPVPRNKASQTQVIVHVREGDSFIAEVDGKQKLAGVLYDLGWIAPGLKGGIVVFDGTEFTSLKISIQTELR